MSVPARSASSEPQPAVQPADDDATLIRRALGGETEAFSGLVQKYRRSVFAFATSRGLSATDADDAAQETFIRAFRFLHTLTSADRFLAWLLKIAANACNDVVRRIQRNAVRRPDEPSGGEPIILPPDNLSDADDKRRVADALATLDDDHRAVLIMRFIEGKNATEIASANGESAGTVRSRIHYALEKLRRMLDNTR